MKILKNILFAALTITAQLGVAQNNCKPSDPKTSEALAEFMKSDLAAKWNASKFGSLSPLAGEVFNDCAKAGFIGFSMAIAKTSNTGRALGYASKDGEQQAMVFEIEEKGAKSCDIAMYDVSGNLLYQVTVIDGAVVDAQAVGGRSGCAGVYLRGFVGTVMGTAGGGPIGFGVGMGMMMFDLWDNGCL